MIAPRSAQGEAQGHIPILRGFPTIALPSGLRGIAAMNAGSCHFVDGRLGPDATGRAAR